MMLKFKIRLIFKNKNDSFQAVSDNNDGKERWEVTGKYIEIFENANSRQQKEKIHSKTYIVCIFLEELQGQKKNVLSCYITRNLY